MTRSLPLLLTAVLCLPIGAGLSGLLASRSANASPGPGSAQNQQANQATILLAGPPTDPDGEDVIDIFTVSLICTDPEAGERAFIFQGIECAHHGFPELGCTTTTDFQAQSFPLVQKTVDWTCTIRPASGLWVDVSCEEDILWELIRN